MHYTGNTMLISDEKIRNSVIIHPQCVEEFIPLEKTALLRHNGIQMGGISRLTERYLIARTNPDMQVFFLTIDGKGMIEGNDWNQELVPGELLLLKNAVPHRYRLTGEFWQVCWFHLDPSRWYLDAPHAVCPISSVECRNFHRIYQVLLDELKYAQAKPSVSRELETVLLDYARRLMSVKETPGPHEMRLREAWEKVRNNLFRKWKIADIAFLTSLSERQFARVHQRLHKESPAKTLNAVRIDQAKKYLLYTNYTLDSIAELIGFATPYIFSAAFKRTVGQSPGAFRSMAHKNAPGYFRPGDGPL